MTETSRGGFADSVRHSADGEDMAGAFRSLEAALSKHADTMARLETQQTRELKEEIRALNKTMIRIAGGD